MLHHLLLVSLGNLALPSPAYELLGLKAQDDRGPSLLTQWLEMSEKCPG